MRLQKMAFQNCLARLPPPSSSMESLGFERLEVDKSINRDIRSDIWFVVIVYKTRNDNRATTRNTCAKKFENTHIYMEYSSDPWSQRMSEIRGFLLNFR